MFSNLMLAEGFEFDTLVPIALFGLVATMAWFVMAWVAARRPRAEERLAEIKNPRLRRGGPDSPAAKKSESMTRVFGKAAPTLAKSLQPKTEKEAGKLKLRLAHAGIRSEAATSVFLGMKIVGLLAGLFFGGGGMLLAAGFTQKSLIYSVAIAGILFYLPDIAVWLLTRSRKQQIFLGLPDALDLMVVCVEAGLALDQAMRKVNEEMAKTYPVIAEEFGLANFQLQMGRTRAEVLHELAARTGVDDVRSLVGIIIQADKFGSSIAQALRVQSDSMRVRRRQIAEEKAAKTAVKLIFPLVIFIFPGIFVVLVGPAAITMVREMFPAMGGG